MTNSISDRVCDGIFCGVSVHIPTSWRAIHESRTIHDIVRRTRSRYGVIFYGAWCYLSYRGAARRGGDRGPKNARDYSIAVRGPETIFGGGQSTTRWAKSPGYVIREKNARYCVVTRGFYLFFHSPPDIIAVPSARSSRRRCRTTFRRGAEFTTHALLYLNSNVFLHSAIITTVPVVFVLSFVYACTGPRPPPPPRISCTKTSDTFFATSLLPETCKTCRYILITIWSRDRWPRKRNRRDRNTFPQTG